MRGLIRLWLSSVVVFGAVMTASPAHATPARGMTAEVAGQPVSPNMRV